MIDGWVTGTVDGRPRITTKGDATSIHACTRTWQRFRRVAT